MHGELDGACLKSRCRATGLSRRLRLVSLVQVDNAAMSCTPHKHCSCTTSYTFIYPLAEAHRSSSILRNLVFDDSVTIHLRAIQMPCPSRTQSQRSSAMP